MLNGSVLNITKPDDLIETDKGFTYKATPAKCQCKKGSDGNACNNRCGCQKNGHKCTSKCACTKASAKCLNGVKLIEVINSNSK